MELKKLKLFIKEHLFYRDNHLYWKIPFRTHRKANGSENSCNKIVSNKTATSVRGVSIRPNGKYQAKICKNKKSYYIGVFDTIDEAENAYREYASILHLDFVYNVNEVKHVMCR